MPDQACGWIARRRLTFFVDADNRLGIAHIDGKKEFAHILRLEACGCLRGLDTQNIQADVQALSPADERARRYRVYAELAV